MSKKSAVTITVRARTIVIEPDGNVFMHASPVVAIADPVRIGRITTTRKNTKHDVAHIATFAFAETAKEQRSMRQGQQTPGRAYRTRRTATMALIVRAENALADASIVAEMNAPATDAQTA